MIRLERNRPDALGVIHDAVRDRMPDMSAADFFTAFRDWDVLAIMRDGVILAGVLVRGHEVHIGVAPAAHNRWASRRIIREVIEPIIARHGRAVTAVATDNERGHDFVRRIGFRQIGEIQSGIVYACDSVL